MWRLEPEAWGLPVRANLNLWPKPLDHPRTLFSCANRVWDEELFASDMASDVRAVRQTFEVLARVGMMYREPGGDLLRLTRMGDSISRFLGFRGDKQFANGGNIGLLSNGLARALGQVVEYSVVWRLMRRCDDRLTNEELNRSIRRLTESGDLEDVIRSVRRSRESDDPTIIGARLYDDSGYGSDPAAQRRAITPLFQRIAGGGLLIDMSGNERRIHDHAIAAIDSALECEAARLNASTLSTTVLAISSRY